MKRRKAEKRAKARARATRSRRPPVTPTAGQADLLEGFLRAALEREEVGTARDRLASERDELANARERALAERERTLAERERTLAERERHADQDRAGPLGAPGVAGDGIDPVLEQARLEALLQRAHLDPLTGAFRREMGRLALRNEIDRARRADGAFVLAFVDVDGLKGVNDELGHAAGDRVLRTLVAIMRANLRSYDPVVRYGGDEFVVGIAAIDPGEVRHRIGVMDQSLRQATGVGITAGLAALTSNESLEELTARADAALLDAKRMRGD